jgi:hypothetical protein
MDAFLDEGPPRPPRSYYGGPKADTLFLKKTVRKQRSPLLARGLLHKHTD